MRLRREISHLLSHECSEAVIFVEIRSVSANLRPFEAC
jgi:hypothetical protein